MSRKLFAVAVAVVVVGCSSADETRPSPYTPPSFLISDGTHSSGNPDFFWLPPMVNDPSGSPNFDVGKFNPDLDPVITICALPGTQESEIGPDTPCSGTYSASSPSAEIPAPVVNVTSEFYQTSWTVPNSDDVFYRIRALVGSKLIGIADVHSVPSPKQLKSVNKNDFVGQQDGSNIPIKFRIERAALCDPPGVYPCNSAGVTLTDGRDVLADTPNGNGGSGIHIPGQPNNNKRVTITVDNCDDLNPRAIDLPTFGSCIRVTSDPELVHGDLAVPATVFVCDVGAAVPAGMSHDQAERITLHQLDIVAGQPVVRALPHAVGCPQLAFQPSIKGLLGALAHRDWRKAGRQMLGLLEPRAAFARRIDQGGGGQDVTDISDFQFALPCKAEIAAGDAQTGAISSLLPAQAAVKCTDLGGTPVANATFHFATGDGSVAPASATTGTDGIAATGWTLGTTVGTQNMTARGRGIAGANADGPRTSFDPFQACPYAGPLPTPDDCSPNGPSGWVLLQTGTRGFTASGFMPFGSSGYSYKVIASNDADPTGWQLSSFNETTNGFSTGATAPFASTGSPCLYSHPTSWPKKTDILIRKTFTLGSAQAVTLSVAVDKDIVEIYLNGVAMTGGPMSHTGCAVPGAADNSVFTGTGAAGTNLIAIRASARSTSAFLDLKVTAP